MVPPSPERLAAERPLNAIHDYFRAASQHDCAKLGTLLIENAKVAQQAICDSYAAFASLRVIEIHGYAKADTPEGFRFRSTGELADQYHVVLDVKHKAGEHSAWREGNIKLLIPMAQEADGQWRLGLAELLPEN